VGLETNERVGMLLPLSTNLMQTSDIGEKAQNLRIPNTLEIINRLIEKRHGSNSEPDYYSLKG
jgi:hypothetical protein